MLSEFELLMPQTLPETLEMLANGAPEVMPLAGGTNMIVDIRGGRKCPKTLLNLSGLSELRGICEDNGYVVIGGGATLAEILDSEIIAARIPVLQEAAKIFANPLVRNRATIGGNLCDASPAADTAPPLLVLNAEVELASKDGTRRLPLAEFFTGVRQTKRQPHELLTAIYVPVMAGNSAGGFRKLALRKADAISVVNAAVLVEYNGGDACKDVRIAMGAVAPTPIRATAAEDALRGKKLTPELVVDAVSLVCDATCCIDDVRGAAAYRQRVVGVLVRRLLMGDGRQ